MADVKITALTALTAADPANDVIPIVDVSDTTMAASGTTKKISVNNILSSSPTATGAFTITGDLTVRTTGLKVTSTGVGVGTASPLSVFTAQSQASARLSVRTTDTVFGSVTGGTAFDSLNGSDASLVPFGCRGSTITLASSAGIGFQIDASGNVTFQNVGGVAGTALTLNATSNLVLRGGTAGATGVGVTFPATQVASSDANCLDDYEEGTFTPIISGATTAGVGVYTYQVGRYTKVGRIVHFQLRVAWTAHTGTGNMIVDGLPFTSSSVTNSQSSVSIGFFSNITLTASNVATAFVVEGNTFIAFYQYPVGGGAVGAVGIDTAGDVMFSGSYTV